MRWLTLLLIAITATGCVSNDTVDDVDVNPDKIWGHYEAVYSAQSNNLLLTAQLRLGGDGGTTIRLTDPASLTVNGGSMRFVDGDDAVVNLLGSFYILNESTETPAESHTFVWTRQDGSTATNVVEQAKPIAATAPEASAQISKGAALTISWANAVEGSGFVVARVDTDVERNTTFARKQISSGSSLVIPADEMADFPVGPATIQLQRWIKLDTTEGHPIGGVRRSGYYSQKITVEIVE
jgi:hypothetical protein